MLIKVNEQEIPALVDCGSAGSLMEAKTAKKLGLPMNEYLGRGVKAVNGSKVKIIGESFSDIDLLEDEDKKTVNIRL